MRSSARMSPLMMLLGAIFFFSTNVFAIAAVLGVDLGTEYIKAALVKPGVPLDIVLTKDSRRKETSAVAFKPTKGGAVKDTAYPERLYGADAMALSARFPGEVYPNLKTLLGLPVDDELVKDYAARHPALQLETHPTRNTAEFKTKTLTTEEDAWMVEELLAMELQSIQKNAEAAAGDTSSVRSVVITIPPFYTIEEKRAVQMAAEMAGLKVLSLISDGLAVGLNYATTRQFPNINEGAKPEYHMVFDMGAGSTKASVLKFQSRTVPDVGKFNKTVQEIQNLGSGWDRSLGGDALNYLIVDDMVAQFVDSKAAKKAGVTAESVKAHGRAIAKLTKEAERVRHVLSANQNTQASFEGLYEDIDFKYKITRPEFEEMAKTHAERIGKAVSDALKMAGLDMLDMTSVILHGGASRTPFVQKALEQVVGSSEKIRSNVNSDEAAVFGAGFRAAQISPSFRVKEIRISEGSMYTAGVTYNGATDKTKRQRLWNTISPMGGAAKELTLTENADFTGTIYQQVVEDDKTMASYSTKNLTETVAAMKSKYPSCDESEILFKMTFQLNAETGEPEISKAFVQCKAEVKEGFVDGVKNLFGFGGKKDQEPLDGEEASSGDATEAAEKAEEAETKADATEDPTGTSSASESTPEVSPSDAAPAEKKLESVTIPVGITIEKAGVPQLTKTELTKSKDRLKGFATSDKARLAREEALNQLEGFTYKIRDLLEGEDFIAASAEAIRSTLAEKSSAASEWLYGDGAEATKDELKAKLKELQDLVSPVQKRIEEAAKRPELISTLKASLNQTKVFLEAMDSQIEQYESWQAAHPVDEKKPEEPPEVAGDFDGLEDEQGSEETEKQPEDRGPVPPLYKRADLAEVSLLHQSIIDWLKDLETRQDVLSANDEPVLLVKDLISKTQALEKAGRDLAMKGVNSFEKKGKKSSKSSDKKKSSKTASGGKEQPTINFDDFEGGKVFTGEDLEELMKKLEEQKKTGDAPEGDRPHDEL